MLSIKHDAKLFYRIDLQKLKGLDDESKEIIGHINSTWSDVEYLNYLFHKNFGRLSDDSEVTMMFSALVVFSESFYVHLSTLYLLMKKLGNKHSHVKKLVSLNEKFFDQIQTIRNCLLIHKEKSFYKRQLGSSSSTDPAHLIEHKILVVNDDGTKRVYNLRPLKHIDMMWKLLTNVEHLLINDIKN